MKRTKGDSYFTCHKCQHKDHILKLKSKRIIVVDRVIDPILGDLGEGLTHRYIQICPKCEYTIHW